MYAIKKLPARYMGNLYMVFKIYRKYKIVQPYNNHYGIWHRIYSGHNLIRISRRYEVGLKAIKRVNRLKSDSIRKGDWLFIPFTEAKIDRLKKVISIGYNKDLFRWPLEGRISSPFGLRNKKLHKGIDIATTYGKMVYAACDGLVVSAAYHKKGYGNVVYIKHEDGLSTRYAHLSKRLVKKGDRIKKGQPIGCVGKTGRTTGSHLHFEIRIKKQPIDPLLFLPDRKSVIVSRGSRKAVGGK